LRQITISKETSQQPKQDAHSKICRERADPSNGRPEMVLLGNDIALWSDAAGRMFPVAEMTFKAADTFR
jgi:hypothetical protein